MIAVVWDLQADDISSRANAKKSAFLQLPPEIRNRIYEYALGNRTLHIVHRAFPGEATPRLRATECAHLEKKMITYGDKTLKGGACSYKAARLHVALLRCSRQIYGEAALIPYSANTFHLISKDYSVMFFNSLMPAQRRAIESVQISDQLRLNGGPYIDTFRLKGLTGLKHLSIDIYYSRYDWFRIEDLKRVEDNCRIIESNILPTTASVHIFGPPLLNPQELQKKATAIEKIIKDGAGRAEYHEQEKIKAKQALDAKKEKEKQALERKATLKALVKRKRDKDRGDAAIARDNRRQAR